VNCDYDPATRRLYEHGSRPVVYNWDHTGVQLPEDPAEKLDEFAIDDGTQLPPV